MTDPAERRIARWSLVVSILALIISALALWQSRRQINVDYDAAIVVTPGVLPIRKFAEGDQELVFEITNTSKDNVQYSVRAETNMGCLKGTLAQPRMVPCSYESQTISLSKPEAGSHKFTHKISLSAAPGSVPTSPLAIMSDPKYFLSIEIVNASTKRALFHSMCYYTHLPDAKKFDLYLPVMDTTGASVVLQAKCQG